MRSTQLRFPFRAAPATPQGEAPSPVTIPARAAAACDTPSKVERCRRLLAGLGGEHRDKVRPAAGVFDYERATAIADMNRRERA